MIDEGYTKYRVDWRESSPIEHPAIAQLAHWRSPLFASGLIGLYADVGIGYGNISARVNDIGLFIISGTQTGHLAHTDNRHYALVTVADIRENRVVCRGACQASSETLTHASLYEADASIQSVVHVHHDGLWKRLKNVMPTTGADIAYGTPEMAQEFRRLYDETDFATSGVAVMAGHESGLISIGADMEQAATRVLSLYASECNEREAIR